MAYRLLFFLVFLLILSPSAWAASLKVDEVRVRGQKRVDAAAIRTVIKVAPAAEVTLDAVDRDLLAIYDLNRFDDVQALLEEEEGTSILVYLVKERPVVRRVTFVGNEELPDDKLRPLLGYRTPDILNPEALEASREAIRKAYGEEGYYAAQVTISEEKNERRNEIKLTYAIDEGEKVLVDTIRFIGNSAFDEDELKEMIQTQERWFLSWLTGRGTYQEELLQNDLEIIADQYFNLGYVQVRVRQPQVVMGDDRETLDLVIEIEEGEQFRVGAMDVRGDLIRGRDELMSMVTLKPGEIFSREVLRESVMTLNDLYSDMGYAYVNVSPLTQLDPASRTVELTFDIEQGEQVKIGRIEIAGNTKTRDKVIRREMKLVEGDLYSAVNLRESRRRIYNLGFFEEVNLSTRKGSESSLLDLDIEVKEKPTGTFSLGFGYSSVDHFIGQGSVTQENFLGRALKLNLSASFGSSSTTYQVGILDPHFLDSKYTLGFDLYNTRRTWADFTRETTGGDIKTGFPLNDTSRAFFIYRYEDKKIYDIDPGASLLIRRQEGVSTLSSLYASVTRDTTDYRLDPSTGTISTASVEFAGLGGTEKFAKYEVDQRYFHPLWWDTVLSLHGHLGFIHAVGGEEIPIDERFYLGGLSSVRGFKSRRVGPRVRNLTELVDPRSGAVSSYPEDFEYIGGEKAAWFNAEYLFPLVEDAGLKGLFFFDAGNAWLGSVPYFDNMRYSVGGGIRWMSPMGPLRLEWGKNLAPRESEPSTDMQFTIGTAF